MKRITLFFLIAIFISGLSLNCAARTIYIKRRPPVVRIEVKPARPFANAIWVPGHWSWRGNNYAWTAGHWIKPRHGYAWVAGHWVKKRRGWVWKSGHWKRI